MNTSSRGIAGPALVAVRSGALALVAGLYFLGLGNGSLWDNSEPTYGEVVKEMFRTGDWLSMHWNYAPWYIHPPLWMWTTGGSVALFGLNEFGVRFASALFGVLGVIAVYFAGRKLAGEIAGIVSGLALGSSLEYVVLARLAILDTALICFMTVTTMWGYFALRDGDRRAFWIAIVAAALGTLTKGPVAVVLPVLVLAVWYAAERSGLVRHDRADGAPVAADFSRPTRPIRSLPWLSGIAAYAVLAGWWFALQTALHGTPFVSEYLGRSTFGRYLTPFENQPGPFYYYIPLLLLGFFPWIAFLPRAVKEAWLARRSDDVFLLCAAAVPFVFFSLAQTKLPNYLGIIFPALALMIGATVGRAIEDNAVVRLRGALLMLPLALVLLTLAIVFYVKLQALGTTAALVPPLRLLGWIVLPSAVLTFALTLALRRAWIAPAGLALMMGGVVAALVLAILPGFETRKPMKAMAAKIMSLLRPGDAIAITGVHNGFSLLFYTDGVPIDFLQTEGAKENAWALRGRRRGYVLIAPYEYANLVKLGVHVRVLDREPTMWLITNR